MKYWFDSEIWIYKLGKIQMCHHGVAALVLQSITYEIQIIKIIEFQCKYIFDKIIFHFLPYNILYAILVKLSSM